jgi:hypothetical protein
MSDHSFPPHTGRPATAGGADLADDGTPAARILAEDLFRRLVGEAARDAAARAQFAATLARYGLPAERQEEFRRRFEEAARAEDPQERTAPLP